MKRRYDSIIISTTHHLHNIIEICTIIIGFTPRILNVISVFPMTQSQSAPSIVYLTTTHWSVGEEAFWEIVGAIASSWELAPKWDGTSAVLSKIQSLTAFSTAQSTQERKYDTIDKTMSKLFRCFSHFHSVFHETNFIKISRELLKYSFDKLFLPDLK